MSVADVFEFARREGGVSRYARYAHRCGAESRLMFPICNFGANGGRNMQRVPRRPRSMPRFVVTGQHLWAKRGIWQGEAAPEGRGKWPESAVKDALRYIIYLNASRWGGGGAAYSREPPTGPAR